MKKILLSVFVALFSVAASAGCIVGDRTSVNKSLHAVGEMALTLVATDATGSLRWGIGIAVAAGAYREIYKAHQPGMSCEYSSMAYDLAGIAAGVAVHHFAILPRPGGGAEAIYSTQF